ncbi:MAG: hypothetical protein JW984_04015, partial [Deltaproteobacteria bacterium]|nr:hypothetical protein [Candidatus Zymogenus saltonus]
KKRDTKGSRLNRRPREDILYGRCLTFTIKESISAVEAMLKIISGRKNESLGDAFKNIEKSGRVEINTNLQEAYKRIYGWASNEGIRHPKTKGDIKIFPEDAKYMLVSCSAFVNYLKEKAIRGGIKF